eukprot:6111491-Prymnesium_polylepis.1
MSAQRPSIGALTLAVAASSRACTASSTAARAARDGSRVFPAIALSTPAFAAGGGSERPRLSDTSALSMFSNST